MKATKELLSLVEKLTDGISTKSWRFVGNKMYNWN